MLGASVQISESNLPRISIWAGFFRLDFPPLPASLSTIFNQIYNAWLPLEIYYVELNAINVKVCFFASPIARWDQHVNQRLPSQLSASHFAALLAPW